MKIMKVLAGLFSLALLAVGSIVAFSLFGTANASGKNVKHIDLQTIDGVHANTSDSVVDNRTDKSEELFKFLISEAPKTIVFDPISQKIVEVRDTRDLSDFGYEYIDNGDSMTIKHIENKHEVKSVVNNCDNVQSCYLVEPGSRFTDEGFDGAGENWGTWPERRAAATYKNFYTQFSYSNPSGGSPAELTLDLSPNESSIFSNLVTGTGAYLFR